MSGIDKQNKKKIKQRKEIGRAGGSGCNLK